MKKVDFQITPQEKKGFRNVSLSSIITPIFPMEKTDHPFQWKVRLNYIPRFHPNLNFHSTAKK